MKKLIFLFFILFLVSCSNLEGNSKGAAVQSVVVDSGSIAVYFCPFDDCESVLVNFIDSASKSIDCAFYDLGLNEIKEKLLEKRSEGVLVRMVMDDHYLKKFEHDFVRVDSGWGLMHNKFCVIDG
jgi:hypothetical protein